MSLPATKNVKHFLDTSVVRMLMLGTSKYRQYFAKRFGNDSCYISIYVEMEMKRSYLRNLIAFRSTLELPTIPCIADALSYWSNKYRSSQLKVIPQLVGDLLRTHQLDFSRENDKPKALRALAHYIVRFEFKLRHMFKDASKDTTRCARADVRLKVHSDNLTETFREFAEAFDDTDLCRSKCNIDHFFLRRYSSEAQGYVNSMERLPKTSETTGFIKIAANLNEVLTEGANACSCKRCERVGDAVIALDAPRQMTLEHIDRSFNHLCHPLNQPHQQHPSETAIIEAR